jgi:hypothetical protein
MYFSKQRTNPMQALEALVKKHPAFVYYENLNAKALRMFRQVVQNDSENATFHLHLAWHC